MDSPDRPLSTREQDVARLVAEGFTNREIAQKLGLAESTVTVHLSAAFRKLRLRNRAAVAAWWARGKESA